MADDVDIATAINERAMENAIARHRAELPPGEPGECEECEHHSPRLIGGRCAPCRTLRQRGRRR